MAKAETDTPVELAPVTAEGALIETPAPDAGSPKELFASLLATAPEESKLIARQLGTALSLHTLASYQADITGEYKPGDLNK